MLTEDIQKCIPYCMFLANDIILIEEPRKVVNLQLELWRQTWETKGFYLSRSRAKYMQCNFSKRQEECDMEWK